MIICPVVFSLLLFYDIKWPSLPFLSSRKLLSYFLSGHYIRSLNTPCWTHEASGLLFVHFSPLVCVFFCFFLFFFLLIDKISLYSAVKRLSAQINIFSYSSEMMGDPGLAAHLDLEEMGPLISQEGLEQLQNKYVQSVRVRLPFVVDRKHEVTTKHLRNAGLYGWSPSVNSLVEKPLGMDAEGAGGWTDGLAKGSGAWYWPRGLLPYQPSYNHHSGQCRVSSNYTY